MRSKVFGSLSSTVCSQCNHRLPCIRLRRSFSASQSNNNDDPKNQIRASQFSSPRSQSPQKLSDDTYSNSNAQMKGLWALIDRSKTSEPTAKGVLPLDKDTAETADLRDESTRELEAKAREVTEEPHHLHVVSTHHNTHITLTRQNHTPMFTFSCGTIGFKKAKRGEYDAAHQLAAYSLGKIVERGYLKDIKKIELVLRGFGPGREATTKAIMGQEGRRIKDYIVRVTDSTRLKFGGTRSRKVRRL